MNEERKVKILGHELAITFNMAVQIKFEDASCKAFELANLETQKATMQLCYASLKEANGKLPFTFDELLSNLTLDETAQLKSAVIEAMNEWFKIPEVINENEKPEEGEDGAKN